MSKSKKSERKPVACDVCGKEFVPHGSGKHKRCSQSCKDVARTRYLDAWYREHRRNDEFRAKDAERHRELYATNPEYRSKHIARSCKWFRDRYRDDPAFRERTIARNVARARIRYATDMEYRSKRNHLTRHYYARSDDFRDFVKASARVRNSARYYRLKNAANLDKIRTEMAEVLQRINQPRNP